jgi:hypothetical protein
MLTIRRDLRARPRAVHILGRRECRKPASVSTGQRERVLVLVLACVPTRWNDRHAQTPARRVQGHFWKWAVKATAEVNVKPSIEGHRTPYRSSAESIGGTVQRVVGRSGRDDPDTSRSDRTSVHPSTCALPHPISEPVRR